MENKNGWFLELARLKVKLTQAEITISKALDRHYEKEK